MPQPRQRHALKEDKLGNKKLVNYTSDSSRVKAYKSVIQLSARVKHKGPPLEGPLQLWIWFYFERPKSLAPSTRTHPYFYHRPDFDNIAKAVCDALNGILWKDDGQIAAACVFKHYCENGEQPHTRMIISTLSDEE